VKYDPFRQASENNSREGYNAIEMARQIAILIMESRAGIDGVKYDRFEDMVLAGECDRKFYAQVANGYIHKIPDGMGGKIVNATGLSLKRLSQYRALLRLTDDEDVNDNIWIEADTNAWTENYIRETVLPSLKPQAESSTAVEHQDDQGGMTNPFKIGDVVRISTEKDGEFEAPILFIESGKDGESRYGINGPSGITYYAKESQITLITPDNPSYEAQDDDDDTPPTKPFTPNRDGFGKEFEPQKPSPFGSAKPAHAGGDGEIGAPLMNLKGKKVRLRDGREGTIWEDTGGEKLMFLKTGATISNPVYRSAIAAVMNEDTARVSDKPMPAPSWSPSDSSNQRSNPHDRFIQDSRIKTMVAQARYLMASLGDKEAEDSLALLSGLTLGDIQKVSKANHPDSVQDMLGEHYEHIANGMQKFMSEIEDILRNWALLDEAERRGE
jgi:hypothetical protein